jgi:hypothetical protein
LKRPPDKKLVLAVAVLIVVASSVFARSIDHVRPPNLTVLGER